MNKQGKMMACCDNPGIRKERLFLVIWKVLAILLLLLGWAILLF